MKLDDVLTQGEIKDKSLRKAMRGGKTSKKVPFKADMYFTKGMHVGYSEKIDSSDRDQWPGIDV